MYLETSQDILYLVLAFCALWFTLFVCWALWYVISIMRVASRVLNEIHDKIAAIDHAVHAVREKVESSLGSVAVVTTGMKILGSYLAKRGEKAAEQAKKKVSKAKRRIKEALEDEEESEDLS